MANDRKKKTGFFGIFRKSKEVVEQQPAMDNQEVNNMPNDYEGDLVLLTKKMENTMEIPSQGIQSISDGDFDETLQVNENNNNNNNVNTNEQVLTNAPLSTVNEIAEDVRISQNQVVNNQNINISGVVNEINNQNIAPQEPVNKPEENVPIFDFKVEQQPAPQQGTPSLDEFMQNQNMNTNNTPDVNELIYDEQNMGGHQR